MTQKKSNIVAIITMCFIFAMISFVTNMAAPFGNIWKGQYSWAGMMGNMMNFAADTAYHHEKPVNCCDGSTDGSTVDCDTCTGLCSVREVEDHLCRDTYLNTDIEEDCNHAEHKVTEAPRAVLIFY